MSAWATPADIINQYDARTLGALVKDDGTRASPNDLLTDPVLANALLIGSGRAEAALLQGARYSIADLQTLANNVGNSMASLNTANSFAYFKYLVSCIAFFVLWERRPYDQDDRKKVAYEQSEEALAALRSGQDILNLPGPIDAGQIKVFTPSRIEYEQLRTIAGRSRGHYYPVKVMPRIPGC